MLRLVTLCLFTTSALLGGANAFLNELRASTGCGPDYSWVFSREIGLKLALEIAMPIFFLGIISFFASANRRLMRVLSLYVAIIMLFFACLTFFPDYLSGYAPCGSKGDESSFGLLLATIFLWVVWAFCSGILFFISIHQKAEEK